MSWTTICKLTNILPFGGRCALLDGKQVAIFRIQENSKDTLYALSNYDPYSKANVLSRGLVGCLDGKLVITSPVHKHHFELSTGQCLEDENLSLETWKVQIEGEKVQLASNAA